MKPKKVFFFFDDELLPIAVENKWKEVEIKAIN